MDTREPFQIEIKVVDALAAFALASPSKPSERFGLLLQLLRKHRGLTRAKLARISGISRYSLARWEKGLVKYPVQNLVNKLSGPLGVSDQWLGKWFIEMTHNYLALF